MAASLMATPPPSPANFAADAAPPIYISSATLQLKPSNFDTFEWHSRVRTPSPTPGPEVLTPEAEARRQRQRQVQDVVEQCEKVANKQQQRQRQQQQASPTRSHQRRMPAKKSNDVVPETLSGLMDNFMDAERHHTICNSLNGSPGGSTAPKSSI